MGRSWPLQSGQPFGAETKLKMRISERNGSAISFPPYSPRLDRKSLMESSHPVHQQPLSYDGTVGCGHADPAGLVFVKPGPAPLELAVAGPTLAGLFVDRSVA